VLTPIFPNLPIPALLQYMFFGAFLAFLVLAIMFPIIKKMIASKHHETLSKVYSYRIYKIDLNLNKVTFFDKTNPRNMRTTDFDHFLRQYTAEDYYRVENWLRNLLDAKKQTSWHLEARALIHATKNTYFSVLEVTNLDVEKKIIHLNSYLLRYLSPKRGHARKSANNVISMTDASHRLEKASSNRGATYLIRFYYRKYQGNTSTYISAVFLKKLKDKITAFLSMGLYLVEQDASEIILLETKNISANEHKQIAHSIAHTIVRNLEVSGLKDEVAFTIGVVENKHFPHNFEELVHHARLMADRAEKEATLVTIYDQNVKYTEISAKAVDLEVIDIIKSRKYEIRFRPILALKKYEVFAYYCSILINSPLTSNRLELCQTTMESDSCKELLSNMTRQMLQTMSQGRTNEEQQLFFPVSVYERNFILKSLAMMKKAKESNIVLVFDESEINDWDANLGVISQMLTSFKDKGLKTALSFADMHLLLDNEIYDVFDYYILDARMTSDIVANDRQRINVHSLIETLRKFNHPIIAIDMSDLDGVEILSNFEVDGVSAECLSPYSLKIESIEPKIINRIRQFEDVKKT